MVTTSCDFLSREQQRMVYIILITWLLNCGIFYLMAGELARIDMNLRGEFLVWSILTFEYHKHVFLYLP